MKENKKGYEIEELVLKTFLKHVKANNLYVAFRWAVHHEHKNRDLIHALSARMCYDRYNESMNRIAHMGCSFTHSNSMDSILRSMREMHGGTKLNVANDSKFQIVIMQMVNNLIHSCVEHAISHDMKRLEKLGSTIFEEVCKTLLGDSFKDVTEEAMDPRQRELAEKMAAMGGMLDPSHLDRDFLRLMQEQLRQRLEIERENAEDEPRRRRRPQMGYTAPDWYFDIDDDNPWNT